MTVNATVTTASINETFQNQNAWTYSVAVGSPTSTFKAGDWQITSPNSANPGSSAGAVSKFNLTGAADVTFNLQHGGFGATTVGFMQGSNWVGHLTIDTNDTAYMFYCPDTTGAQCDGYLKYPSAWFMNQRLAVRLTFIQPNPVFHQRHADAELPLHVAERPVPVGFHRR